jgi:hypothetical protein
MSKLAMTSIFIGATVFGFSVENLPLSVEITSNEAAFVYEHVGTGCVHLLSHDYFSALESFSIAESYNDYSSELRAEMYFWISLGRAIAYDNLGMGDQCKQAIGSFFLAMYEAQDEVDEEEDGLLSQEEIEAIELVKQIISLAKSPNIRGFLEEIFSDEEE